MTGLVIRGARVLDPLAPEPRPAVRDIAIEGNRIAAVGTDLKGEQILDARNMLAIPGLVSAHYHSHDTLLKGCFAPMPLEGWFMHAVPPNYAKRSREEIRARVLAGALEALKAGITTLQDMATVHPYDPAEVDTLLAAYDEIGIRCVFALQLADAPGSRGVPFWDEVMPPELRNEATLSVKRAGDARELLSRIEAEWQRHRDRHARVTWGLGPATPENCSDAFLEGLADLSARGDLPVFSHVYESKGNALTARRAYTGDGGSLIGHLARVGLLGPRFTAAHAVWLRRDEIDAMAASGARVVLNPVCNLKSKSGVAPIGAFLESGVPVGLGTDNSSCSDAQSLFSAMKLFALLSAAGSRGGEHPGAEEALRAATVGSAEVVGLGREAGRIEPGRKADITLLDLTDAAFLPLNDATRQLVYSECGRAVRHVLVDGKVVLRDGRCTTIDEQALFSEIEALLPRLSGEVAAVREKAARYLPYVQEAHRRAVAADVGLDRYPPGIP
ncbi:MAG: amidohydrolase family protein [Betaproteobacteria bacterium]